jgi:hypothetical protein
MTNRGAVASELRSFAGFLVGLPGFLARRMSPEEARAIILDRIQSRERNFLRAIEQGVFANPRSPYRALFEIAGCTQADVAEMLPREGVDGTLRRLRDAGVYLSFEEFKGRQPIVRGSRTVTAQPEDFDNPGFDKYFHITTGGSTGRGRRVLMDLEYFGSRIPMNIVAERCLGTAGLPSAHWFDIPPGHGLGSVLQSVPAGRVPELWYTPIRGGRDGTSIRFRLATQASLAVARLAGHRLPWPKYLPLDRAEVLAEWLQATLRTRGPCVVRGQVSRVLRIAVAARERGIDLSGAILIGGGEPPTTAKVAVIKSTGATFRSSYFFVEAGPVGYSCTTSEDPNDQHFLKDHLAMIQAPRQVPGFDRSVGAFYYTTLLPTAPKLLLNVESDDYGVLARRSCGCPWEALGFTDHVSEIRSFKKLSGEGVTLIGSDMERVLEEILPARFGGSPLDYQLIEEEDEQGFTRLTLLVSPSVELTDEQGAIQTVLEGLRTCGAIGDLSRALFQQADTFRIRRETPRLTRHGKFMPLQLGRLRAASESVQQGAPH